MTDAAFARLRFPNESAEYRTARNALLDAEIALRRQNEAVAQMRRDLPPGGVVPEDFLFERIGADHRVEKVKMSDLFGDCDSIMIYSFMFGPDRDQPCPGCTHLLDCMEGAARHVPQRAPLYVVARSPIARLTAWACDRGWRHLKMLSSAHNTYGDHYYGHTTSLTPAMRQERNMETGKDWDEPMLNVFTRRDGQIRHFWGSELVFAPDEPGQDHRGLDFADAVWGLLDTIPEGRGETFFPKLSYD